MPQVFQCRCSVCGAATPKTTGSYSAMYVDEPTTSAAAHPEDPHLVVLSSPVEETKSAETARAEAAAARDGRLVTCEQVFCESCGRMFEIRGLSGDWAMFGFPGLLGFIAMAVAAGVALLFGRKNPWGFVAGGVTIVLVLGAVAVGIDWLVRRRYPERAARVATPRRCPACGNRWCKHGSMVIGAIRCVACGKRAVGFGRVSAYSTLPVSTPAKTAAAPGAQARRTDPTRHWARTDGPLPRFDPEAGALGGLALGDGLERAEFLGRPDRVEHLKPPGWVELHYSGRGFQLGFMPQFVELTCTITPRPGVPSERGQGYSRPLLSGGIELTPETTPAQVRAHFGPPEAVWDSPQDKTVTLINHRDRFNMEFEFDQSTGRLLTWTIPV